VSAVASALIGGGGGQRALISTVLIASVNLKPIRNDFFLPPPPPASLLNRPNLSRMQHLSWRCFHVVRRSLTLFLRALDARLAHFPCALFLRTLDALRACSSHSSCALLMPFLPALDARLARSSCPLVLPALLARSAGHCPHHTLHPRVHTTHTQWSVRLAGFLFYRIINTKTEYVPNPSPLNPTLYTLLFYRINTKSEQVPDTRQVPHTRQPSTQTHLHKDCNRLSMTPFCATHMSQ
jgi:hypothetical protein